jgi:hypothetical protein
MNEKDTTANGAPPNRLIMGIVYGVILTGVGLIIGGFLFLRDATASRGWPVADGTVTSVRVTWSGGTRSGMAVKKYFYQVRYRYQVEGRTLSGTRYSLGTGPTASRHFSTEEEARAEARERYPIGSRVEVHYDPENPELAVLQTGVNWGTYGPLLFGLIALPGGIYIMHRIARVNAQHQRFSTADSPQPL